MAPESRRDGRRTARVSTRAHDSVLRSMSEAQNGQDQPRPEEFSHFSDHYSPKIVGELNDFHVKLVKLQGEFVWHHHDVEDELFFVVKGALKMAHSRRRRRARDHDPSRRVHHHSARRRALSLRRRRDAHHAARTQVHAEHRQRRERAHGARVAAALGLVTLTVLH